MISHTTSITLTACLLAALAGGCDRDQNATKSTSNPRPTNTPAPTQPDNTARNRGDDSTINKTPMDQSNDSLDIKVTAEIRRAIMDDKSMSMNAQNCKVITDKSGVVTLRGPVESQAEKDAIAAKAQAVAGVTRVVNELEVKTK